MIFLFVVILHWFANFWLIYWCLFMSFFLHVNRIASVIFENEVKKKDLKNGFGWKNREFQFISQHFTDHNEQTFNHLLLRTNSNNSNKREMNQKSEFWWFCAFFFFPNHPVFFFIESCLSGIKWYFENIANFLS